MAEPGRQDTGQIDLGTQVDEGYRRLSQLDKKRIFRETRDLQREAGDLLLPLKAGITIHRRLPWRNIRTDEQARHVVLLEDYYGSLAAGMHLTSMRLTRPHISSEKDHNDLTTGIEKEEAAMAASAQRIRPAIEAGDWKPLREKWAWAVPPSKRSTWKFSESNEEFPEVVHDAKTKGFDLKTFEQVMRRIPATPKPELRAPFPQDIDPARIIQRLISGKV